MKKILLPSIFTLILLSCGSDENTETLNQTQGIKKIVEVKKDNKIFYKFVYNTDGNISEIYNYFNGIIGSTTRIEYLNGKQIKRLQYNSSNSLSSYQLFTYQGNLITNRKIYSVNNGSEVLISSTDYTNDFSKTNNNIIGIKYYDSSGNLTSRSDINYTDNYGSSISETFNNSNVKTNIVTINKDNLISWDKVLDPFIYQHETNTISSLDKNINTGSTTGYTVEFTYDQNKYPSSAIYKYTDGTNTNYSFSWE